MRLLICAGGTGGGVYPALSVLQTLKNEAHTVLWVGSQGGMEADLVNRSGDVPFEAIPAAGLHGVGLRAMPGNLVQLLRGVVASRRVLKNFRPDVLFFTGGYVAAPMAVAGVHIPSVLFVPDIEPGLALKFLGRFASKIAITCDATRAYYPRRKNDCFELTGYPTRTDLLQWTRKKGREHLNLEDRLPTLLFLGGSKGARSINRALLQSVTKLLRDFQIVHISGSLDWPEIQASKASMNRSLSERYHAFPYLHEDIGAALASADLVISRAGASTLGEYPLFSLPSVLVPYPHAWRYQQINAEFLANKGAAVIIQDNQLQTEMETTIHALFAQPKILDEMRNAMRSLAKPHAAGNLAALLVDTANRSASPGRVG